MAGCRVSRRRVVLFGAVIALALHLDGTGGGKARAQESVRVDGAVHWLSGQTLVLVLDVPAGPPTYVIQGSYVVPLPAPRQTVSVDLGPLPQSEYAFLRPGDRITVIGTLSDDRRRVVATSIIRGPGAQEP